MAHAMNLVVKKDLDAEDGGFFVKGLSSFIISHELRVVPSSSATSFSILSKLGIMDGRAIEVMSFTIDGDQALELLHRSIVSKTPLTEVLLDNRPGHGLSENNFEQGSSRKPKPEESTSNQNGSIVVKLMVSKSKKMVCFAEAGQDFVNLLFSFLTVPLGFMVKQMQGRNSQGCINHLYDSVWSLYAEQYIKSELKKAMLISPKLAPGFSYENQLLGIEEDAHPQFYYSSESLNDKLVSDETLLRSESSGSVSVVTIMDPKSPHKDKKSGSGFLRGPALFTVTYDLMIGPISSMTSINVLCRLKVSFGDIEERIVHVGEREASRLLVASFISKSALTKAFLLKD